MDNKKISSLISLCARARGLVSGETACENAISHNKAKLIIVSADASENTYSKFSKKAFYYEVKLVRYGFKEELGKNIGKTAKSVIAVTDCGFARTLTELLRELA
jgi:ribosomal protein L7Ae-like RNA K-turn-binding protein